jgi:glycosyltransferase involved in cell wall biosynthesis
MAILPSTTRAEGFGLVLLEAMASGRPVVGTNVGGIPYFVQDGFNGLLIPPESPKAISDAVIRILSDKELAKSMGLNGRSLVERDYSWRTMAERTERLYQDLLNPQ